MIEDHELQGNEWLQKIYEKHEKWAPKYVRNVFCAGKRTTQLSESFNATLRRYLNTAMNITRFLQNFQRVVDDLRYNELQADFNMLQIVHPARSGDPLRDHATEVYTPTILRAFLEQSRDSGYLVSDCRRGNTVTEDVVVHVCSLDPRHNCSTARRYVITMENGVYSCSCKHFNFVGIICSHIIWVLKQEMSFVIPDAYILPRWRKDARRSIAPINRAHSTDDLTFLKVINRRKYINQYASLCQQYGARSQAWSILDHHYEALEVALSQLSDDEGPSAPVSVGSAADADIGISAKGFKARAPKHKGTKRVKSGLEQRIGRGRGWGRGRGRGRGGGSFSSQPTARRLQLVDEFEASNEDELVDEEEDDSDDETTVGRFKNLDNL